jgi:hypothetical protein
MILLLIISLWGLLVSVVVGACVAARRGDVRQERASAVATVTGEREPVLVATAPPARPARPQEPVRQLARAAGTAH